jgi:glycosyltransferase involved in cell wall biosynthesis
MAARPDTLRAVAPASAAADVFVPPVLVGPSGRPARIALVHDWFDLYYGSERVVDQILACFPEADVFALVDFMPEEERGFLRHKKVATSFIQRLPLARRHFRRYLPLMPLAIEQFDFGGYDLVLSSSHAIAKGVITGADQPHIAYVHAPMRYAWEFQHDYLRQSGLDRGLKGVLARYVLHRLRLWDARTANGVDQFIANSRYIARRIHKIYRRESLVVHPPVDVQAFPLVTRKDDHYLAVGRFVPYKHLHTIVRAFARLPGRRLVVIGEGDGLKQAQAEAPANVSLLGRQPAAELRRHMQHARALIFAAEEDFGITPLEAQAAGTPVIAYAGGGALETVRGPDHPQPTGLFFEHQTPEEVAAAVERFESDGGAISPHDCRDNALAFAPERFRQAYGRAIIEVWRRHGGGLSPETMTRLARAALAHA